ncbi:aquaporin-like protein [Panaeolus papilionaceus]|nr:aquaporin-like protein [Panaeolus papilionaceus]
MSHTQSNSSKINEPQSPLPVEEALPQLRSYAVPQRPQRGLNKIRSGDMSPQSSFVAHIFSREALRAPLAEFFGVAIFVLIGAGSNCQVALSANPLIASSHKGDYLSLNLGWAIGLALAVWVSAGVSGGHVNPAITLVLATRRKFPWKKVPVYIFAQVMGGVIGAALAYAQYHRAIDIVEGGQRTSLTAGLFAANPISYISNASCFFSEFLGGAVLAFMIIVATDKKNATAPPLYLLPLIIFLTLLGLGAALGMQTSFSFNPARDFGPRAFLGMVGYSGKVAFTFRHQYWLWCPIIAPILGAQVSVVAYDLLLKDNSEHHDTAHAADKRLILSNRIITPEHHRMNPYSSGTERISDV